MSTGKCGFCNSERLIMRQSSRISTIDGLKSVSCQDCGRNSYTRGKIPKLKKQKISSFVGMRLQEALMNGLPICSIVFTCDGPQGPGIVMKDDESDSSRHVNGMAIYFEKHSDYAVGWLSEKIREVQLPEKAKKTKKK
jgi:hypothetical protein